MGLFTKKEKTEEIESFPGARKMRGGLAKTAEPGALERLGRAGETYPGPLVAALSEFEETGLEGLKDWLGTDLPTEGTLYKSAVDEILKTLSEEGSEEYKQAYKTAMLRELEESKDRLAARTSARDKLFGGGRISAEGELEEDFLGQLAVIIAEEDRRAAERRLGAVPQALGLAQYGEAAPMQRIAASQQYGALPRLIEQAEMDAEYQEWMRALNDLGIALDTATGLATYTPTVMTTGGGTKDWAKDVGMAIDLIGRLFGGGGGAGGKGGAGGGGAGGGPIPSQYQPSAQYGQYGAPFPS